MGEKPEHFVHVQNWNIPFTFSHAWSRFSYVVPRLFTLQARSATFRNIAVNTRHYDWAFMYWHLTTWRRHRRRCRIDLSWQCTFETDNDWVILQQMRRSFNIRSCHRRLLVNMTVSILLLKWSFVTAPYDNAGELFWLSGVWTQRRQEACYSSAVISHRTLHTLRKEAPLFPVSNSLRITWVTSTIMVRFRVRSGFRVKVRYSARFRQYNN